ncbi:MAG TPA: IPTL-CTERM sorting domain-containing protein [Thermoanaerobaculia bacterium]|nr:IPTL-CTERM sorting domain-containing protein [Thermoanaerobaculia bacterium]
MPIRLLRHVFALLLLLAFCSRPSSAHMDLRALLDLDDDPTTGCTVATPEGPFAGVEIVATSEVVTDIVPVVEGIELLDCQGNVTEVEVAPGTKGGVPYAVGLGAGGFDAIETFVPLAGLPGVSGNRPIRVGFVAEEPELEAADALLTANGQAAGAVIRVPRGASVVAVPTLGEWGLLALALGMASAGAIALRRRGLRALSIALLVLGGGLGAFQIARATLVPDGDLSAWTADLLRAIDVDDPSAVPPAAADASEGANLLRAYGAIEDGVLYLRVDVNLALSPILRSSGHSTFTPGGGPVAVDALLTVADFDDTQLQGGTVTLLARPDGAAETLAVSTAGTAITAVWDEPTTTFTLSGADSLAHYQQVLRSVTYDNSTPVPQVGARTVIFTVRDDNSTGVPVESSVRIEASARNPG